MRLPDRDTRFSMARALYWYCVDTYNGMGDPKYACQCTLGYTPGPLERSPACEYADGEACEDHAAAEVYYHLTDRKTAAHEIHWEHLQRWLRKER